MRGKTPDEELITSLTNEPTSENWARLESWLAGSKSRYYKIYYREGNISSEQDLLGSHASIYDSKGREVAKVPIYEKEADGGIKGALIHLRGLVRTG